MLHDKASIQIRGLGAVGMIHGETCAMELHALLLLCRDKPYYQYHGN